MVAGTAGGGRRVAEGTEEEVGDDEAGGKEEVVDVGTCNEGESAK